MIFLFLIKYWCKIIVYFYLYGKLLFFIVCCYPSGQKAEGYCYPSCRWASPKTSTFPHIFLSTQLRGFILHMCTDHDDCYVWRCSASASTLTLTLTLTAIFPNCYILSLFKRQVCRHLRVLSVGT